MLDNLEECENLLTQEQIDKLTSTYKPEIGLPIDYCEKLEKERI